LADQNSAEANLGGEFSLQGLSKVALRRGKVNYKVYE